MFFFQLQWFVRHLGTLLTRMSLSTPSPWKCQPFDQTVLMPDLRRLTRNLLSSALLPVKFSFIISLHPFQGGCWTVSWPDLLPAVVRALQDPEAPPVWVEFFPAFRVLQLSPVVLYIRWSGGWGCFRCLLPLKVVMQGKLIAVAYTLSTYWNQFSGWNL